MKVLSWSSGSHLRRRGRWCELKAHVVPVGGGGGVRPVRRVPAVAAASGVRVRHVYATREVGALAGRWLGAGRPARCSADSSLLNLKFTGLTQNTGQL